MIQLKALMKKSWFHFELGVPFLNILNFIGLCMHGISVSYVFADHNQIARKVSLNLVIISSCSTNYSKQNLLILTLGSWYTTKPLGGRTFKHCIF